ncbi:MAG TPA: NAD-dependent epimerase/dehydratase family protein, partial [Chthoniobacterales bacterium]|nr:NAD-dependent epimerase/dehydratase family protein [Chthoniobacterales bacterium]
MSSDDHRGNYLQKKVLVTGGAGFLGSQAIRRLVKLGADVTCLHSPGSNLIRLSGIAGTVRCCGVDLRDRAAVHQVILQSRPTVVFHLAAAGVDPKRNDPHEIFETNVLGFLNLLTSAEAAGVERVVGAGSCFEYDATSAKPLVESDPLLPLTAYASSKSSAVMLASAFAKTHRLKVVMLRPFTAYGPYERPDRLIPHVILAAMRHAPIRLTGGEQTRDFVYVEDAADAFIVAGLPGAPSGEVFNIGTGHATAVSAVARRILELMQ